MAKLRIFNRLRRLSITMVVLVVILGVTSLAAANFAGAAIHEKAAQQFDWDSSQVTRIVQRSLNGYSTVLYMGRSLLITSPNTTQAQWTTFFRTQDIFNQFKGMNSVNAIQLVPDSQKAAFVAERRRMPEFGPNFTVNPPGSRPVYGLGILTLSKNNVPLSGFDVYSTPERAQVYRSALESGQPAASGQIQLNTGKQGMFVTVPVTQSGDQSKFVTVALYTDHFFADVLSATQMGYITAKVTDITDPAQPQELYKSPGWDASPADLQKEERIDFAGRTWKIAYHADYPYTQRVIARFLPYTILMIGLLLTGICLLVYHIIYRTVPKSKTD